MAFKLPTGSVRRDVHDRHGASTKLGVFCQRYNSKHANRQHEPGSLNLAARIPALAIDVEHAHFKRNGQRSKAAAEVCVTREDNSCLIQSFICPDVVESLPSDIWGQEGVRWIGGVKPEHFEAGPPLAGLQDQLLGLLSGHRLIGYGLKGDLAALHISHRAALQKDLMRYRLFQSKRSGSARKLQSVARQYLGVDIQSTTHSAREDAQAVMQLYLQYVKDDAGEMIYDQLVDSELRQLLSGVSLFDSE